MPNKPKCKTKIDAHAKKAIARLDKVLKKHKGLKVELKPVKTHLLKITSDPHML